MAAFDNKNAWWSNSGKTLSVLAIMLSLAVPALPAQSGGQTSSQQPSPQSPQQPAQQPANSQPAQDIPDAPSTVQPPAPKIPASTPDNPKKPDENPFPGDAPRLPQTQSREQSGQPGQQTDQQADQDKARPMPAVVTVPPGSGPRNLINPGFTIKTSVNLVLVPAMVKDSDGRRVDGLLPKDFTVLENGQKQPLTFFT